MARFADVFHAARIIAWVEASNKAHRSNLLDITYNPSGLPHLADVNTFYIDAVLLLHP